MSGSGSDSDSTEDWDADFPSEEGRKAAASAPAASSVSATTSSLLGAQSVSMSSVAALLAASAPAPVVSPGPLKITGVVAKATDDIEDWDQDFLDDADEQEQEDPTSPRSLLLDHESPRTPSARGRPGSSKRHVNTRARFGMHVRARHKSLASDRLDALAQRLLRLRSAAYSLATESAAQRAHATLTEALKASSSSGDGNSNSGGGGGNGAVSGNDTEAEAGVARAQQQLSEARDEAAAAASGAALAEWQWRLGHVEAALSDAQQGLRALDSAPAPSAAASAPASGASGVGVGASAAGQRQSLLHDERQHLRARLLLVQARAAHAQLDAFKAARALKQAASALADTEHVRATIPARDEALHARVQHELAAVLDEREQSGAVADALIAVVSATLTLSTWTLEQLAHLVSAAFRLAEFAHRCDDPDVARFLLRALLALAPASSSLSVHVGSLLLPWTERARALQRALSGDASTGVSGARSSGSGPELESSSDADSLSLGHAQGSGSGSGATVPPIHVGSGSGEGDDSDEASDWDLELSLTAGDEDADSAPSTAPSTQSARQTRRALRRQQALSSGSLSADDPALTANGNMAAKSKSEARAEESEGSDWDKEFADSDDDSEPRAPSGSSAQPGASASASARTSASASAKAAARAASRRALLSLAQPPRIDVKRYELLPERSAKGAYKAVKYPPPSFLYTLRTRDKHKLMNESQLEAWLAALQVRQKDLLLGKNQPPSLRDLDVATETFLRAHHAHWAWQALASEGALAWEPVARMLERLEKHVQACAKRGQEHDRFDSALADLAHFLARHATPAQLPDALAALKVAADYSPAMRPVARLLEGALYGHLQAHNPIGIFCKVYQRAKRAEPALSDRDVLQLDECSAVGLQARALAYLHLYLVERSPLSTARQTATAEVSSESSEDEIIDRLCADDDARVQLLRDLYPYLRPALLKAECAFVLALHAVDKNDLALAEKIAFEAVYILATIDPPVKGLSHLLTELGSNALALYADVLRSNGKYKYSALAFEAALSVLRLLGKTEEYNALLESFAKIAHAENDLRRSVNCYTEIVAYYQRQQPHRDRRNEIIYVSEILGSMFVELGDFISAEGYIKTALQFFSDHETTDTRPPDPTYIRLQILLAHTYLLSYSFEKGITLLEYIMALKLPLKQEKQVVEMLITAYRKKGWHKEGGKLLETFKTLVDQEEKETGVQNTADLIKFWKIAALHFFKSEQYKAAVCCVDKAIMTTDTSSFAVLGRLYLLRGKILLDMCKHPGAISFPTSFQPDTKIEIAGENLTTTISYTTFSSQGDLIQECVATFKQSTFYFEGTGDDVHLAHTTTRLSEVLLEVCFPAVALYDASFVDVASLPYFHPSFIAQNTREAQKRKREQQEHRRQKTMQRESERLKEKRRLRESKRSAYLPNPIAPQKDHSASPSQFSGFTNFILPKAFGSGEYAKRKTNDSWSGSASVPESAFLNSSRTTQIYIEPDREVLLVLVLGWSGVGRTSIITRLVKGNYNETVATSSQDEISDLLVFQGRKVRFISPQLNATEPLDKTLERLPRKQLRGVLLCYDVTDRDSFHSFVEWWSASSARNLPAVLVGNRAGEGEQREVLQTQVGDWVSARQLKCFDVSAKEGLGLNDALAALIEGIDCAIMDQDVVPILTLSDAPPVEPSQMTPTSTGSGSVTGSTPPDAQHTRSLPIASSSRSRSVSQGHSRKTSSDHIGPPGSRLTTYSQSKSDAEDSESDSDVPTHKRALSGSDNAPINHDEDDVPISPTSARSRLLQLPAQFLIRLDQVRDSTEIALDLANDCAHLFLMLRGYLNMAELQFLEGDTSLALQFWEQCARHIQALFVARDHSMLRDAPPSGLRKLLAVVRRALRFLVCQSKETINAHLSLVDFYHVLQTELDVALRRELPPMDPPRTASSAPATASALPGVALLGRRRLSGALTAPSSSSPSLLPPSGREEKRMSIRMSISQALDFSKSSMAKAEADAIAAEADRGRLAVAKKCALAWGFLHFVKQQAERYIEGKLSLEALRTTSQRSYRKMAKISALLRSGDVESIADLTDTPRMRRRKSARIFGKNRDVNVSRPSLNPDQQEGSQGGSTGPDEVDRAYSVLSDNARAIEALERIVVILQLDEHVVYYAAGSGRRRVQRLAPRSVSNSASGLSNSGGNASESSGVTADSWLPVEIVLLSGSGQGSSASTLQLNVRASCSLENLLRLVTDDNLDQLPVVSPPAPGSASSTPGTKERSKTRSLFSILTPFFSSSDKKEKEREREQRDEIRIVGRDTDFSTHLRALAAPVPTSPVQRRLTFALGDGEARQSESDSLSVDSDRDAKELKEAQESKDPKEPARDGEKGKEKEKDPDTAWRLRVRLARRVGPVLGALHARMSARLRDVFSAAELQRALSQGSRSALRIVAYSADDVRASKSVQDDAVVLTDVLQRFLVATALDDNSSRSSSVEAVAREFRHTFSGLSDVLPSSGPSAALSGFATIRGDAWHVSDPDAPLVLLCSPQLHAVPWELLLDDALLVRTFSLREHLRAKYLPSEPSEERESAEEGRRLAQTLWVSSPSQPRGVLEAEVAARKMALKKLLLHRLRLLRRYELPRPPPARWPLPSLLVTRSSSLLRRDGVRILECPALSDPLRLLASTPLGSSPSASTLSSSAGAPPAPISSPSSSLLRVFDSGSVVVLGMGDLLEMSDALLALRLHPRSPTLLFVPDAHVKAVVRAVLKAHAALLKRAKSERGLLRCDALLDTLRKLLLETRIPLSIFNPPWGR